MAVAFDVPEEREVRIYGRPYMLDYGQVHRELVDRMAESDRDRITRDHLAKQIGISRMTLWEFLSGGQWGQRTLFAILGFLDLKPSQVTRPVPASGLDKTG